MADRSTEAEKAARKTVEAARRHLDELTAEYGQAFTKAIERDRAQLQGKRVVYAEGAVLVRLTDAEAKLRRQLQAATVAVTEAEKQYRHAQALALVLA